MLIERAIARSPLGGSHLNVARTLRAALFAFSSDPLLSGCTHSLNVAIAGCEAETHDIEKPAFQRHGEANTVRLKDNVVNLVEIGEGIPIRLTVRCLSKTPELKHER